MHLQIYDPDNNAGTDNDIVAMYTTNYLDVFDAARGDGVAATVAMEYSPHPIKGGIPYIKFYLFDAVGDRSTQIDLDGGGLKAVPDLCVNCHGGQPAEASEIHDAGMVYPDKGRLGDKARFIAYALETFEYAEDTFPRDEQEENFRKLNESLLKSNVNATARVLLHGWYGNPEDYLSDELAQPGAIQDEHWYPTGDVVDTNGAVVGGDWAEHQQLYEEFYQPYCRTCHLSFDGMTFDTADSFLGMWYMIESHLCGEETYMPQAKVTQRALFRDDDAIQLLIDEMIASKPENGGWSTLSCP
jgi:hypothetical protein